MNKCYQVVWNESRQTWQVVSETARHRGSNPAKSILAAAALNLGSLLGAASFAADLPAGGKITFGSGSIQQTPSQLTIHQSSPQMALDWKSFNIGADKSVQFVQPSANAAAINRVTGIDASVIAGRLHANGTVVLINPDGVLFTPTAEVNVGSLVASTLKTITNLSLIHI